MRNVHGPVLPVFAFRFWELEDCLGACLVPFTTVPLHAHRTVASRAG